MYDRETEFFDHVWNHTNDAFLNKFMYGPKLSTSEKQTIKKIICILRNGNDQTACDKIYKILSTQKVNDNIILVILQLVGSTRNKILTDLRAMLQTQQISVPTKPELLLKNEKALHYAEKYLTDIMRHIFSEIINPKCKIEDEQLFMILDIVHKATRQGWIRQERAKKSGHYAEYRLAKMLHDLKIPFAPKAKLRNRASKDIRINGISYDLVIPNSTDPKICFKCTVHTSPPGQYGESKDGLEAAQAKDSLEAAQAKDSTVGFSIAPKPLLVSLIDGIGLQSNRAVLKKVLENTDEFCQFATLWKVVVIYASIFNHKVNIWIPDFDKHKDFLEIYKKNVHVQNKKQKDYSNIGEAWLKLNTHHHN